MQYPSMVPMQGTLSQSSAQTVLIDPSSQQWRTQSLPYATVQQQFYTSRMSNGTIFPIEFVYLIIYFSRIHCFPIFKYHI